MFCAPPGLDGGEPGVVGEVRWNGQTITRFPPWICNRAMKSNYLCQVVVALGPCRNAHLTRSKEIYSRLHHRRKGSKRLRVDGEVTAIVF